MADFTPFKCWNTSCTPQKQPPAKTTVSSVALGSTVSSWVAGGTITAVSAWPKVASEKLSAEKVRRAAAAERMTLRGNELIFGETWVMINSVGAIRFGQVNLPDVAAK